MGPIDSDVVLVLTDQLPAATDDAVSDHLAAPIAAIVTESLPAANDDAVPDHLAAPTDAIVTECLPAATNAIVSDHFTATTDAIVTECLTAATDGVVTESLPATTDGVVSELLTAATDSVVSGPLTAATDAIVSPRLPAATDAIVSARLPAATDAIVSERLPGATFDIVSERLPGATFDIVSDHLPAAADGILSDHLPTAADGILSEGLPATADGTNSEGLPATADGTNFDNLSAATASNGLSPPDAGFISTIQVVSAHAPTPSTFIAWQIARRVIHRNLKRDNSRLSDMSIDMRVLEDMAPPKPPTWGRHPPNNAFVKKSSRHNPPGARTLWPFMRYPLCTQAPFLETSVFEAPPPTGDVDVDKGNAVLVRKYAKISKLRRAIHSRNGRVVKRGKAEEAREVTGSMWKEHDILVKAARFIVKTITDAGGVPAPLPPMFETHF